MTAVGDVKLKTKAIRSTCAVEIVKVMKPQQSSTGMPYVKVKKLFSFNLLETELVCFT